MRKEWPVIPGRIVRSRAGRDEGRYFVVIALDGDEFALVADGVLPLEGALQLVTSNPARNLSLRQKGRIAAGCDADFVALNEDLSIHSVYAKGKKVHENE